jgi:hypothetical protein
MFTSQKIASLQNSTNVVLKARVRGGIKATQMPKSRFDVRSASMLIRLDFGVCPQNERGAIVERVDEFFDR